MARRSRERREREKELLVDPRLFRELARRRSEVSGVWLEVKGGQYNNELTKFRYDALLAVGGEAAQPRQLAEWAWRSDGGLAALEELLSRHPTGLVLRSVPSSRLTADLATAAALSRPGEKQTVRELRRELASRTKFGASPSQLWDLAGRHGMRAYVGWAISGHPGELDAVFLPRTNPHPAAEARLPPLAAPGYRGWTALGNQPLAAPVVTLDFEDLKVFLAARLPAWMVPSVWTTLAALPLTPNGKIDRQRLPDPAPETGSRGLYQAPRGPLEELLAEIFAAVLNLPRVGRTDDFFALGGHSLRAAQVVTRLRQVLAVELPLRRLFEAPTVSALARQIAELAGGEPPPRPELRPGERPLPAPLSFAQERLWFIEQLQPGTAVYNLPLVYRAQGRLEVAALAAALAQILARHEVLRTVYRVVAGRPVQAIAPPPRFLLPQLDLTALKPAHGEPNAQRLSDLLVRRPFELSRDLMLRALLIRLGADDHLLSMATHHIAFDGSLHVFARELIQLYRVNHGGGTSLPPLPIQYADFAAWQRRWLEGDIEHRLLAYWKNRLANLPPTLELPLDRPRPAVLSSAGASQLLKLPPELGSAARALARREGVTLFMIGLAALKALLLRLTGQSEIAVGSPVVDRPHAELDPLIGNFVNTVVLFTRIGREASFRELLRGVRETALGAYAHQELPFEALVEALQPERNLRQTALFQVMFVLLNESALAGDLELPGLLLAQPKTERGTARFDLLLALWEGKEQLTGTLEYRTDLFDRTTILRLLESYQRLLEAALAAPSQRLTELPIWSPAERQQLLAEWNDTATAARLEPRLEDLFFDRAGRCPESIAVEGDGEALTYGALGRRVRAISSELVSRGARPGELVGICLERSQRLVEALLAALASGAAYVPMEPTFPEARRAFILSSLKIRWLFTESRLAPAFTSLATGPDPLELLLLDQALPAHETTSRPAGADSSDLAYVIFTSGSTGTPKGVMVRHQPVVNLIDWVNSSFAVGPGDRLLFTTSPCFDLSVYDVFGVLAAGGTVRVASDHELAEPELLVRALVAEGITFWDSAPAALQRLVPLFAGAGAPFAGSTLRLVFLSGDWIGLPLPDRLRETFPGVRVVSLGGATEATVWSNVFEVGQLDPFWISIPYGRPIHNARYHVLDHRLSPSPIGVAGDLYIGGDCLASGYLGAATLTASKFLPDPFGGDGSRLYRTGDRARAKADGNLEFLGRLDHQVKIRGYRIELGEIEAVLSEHHQLAAAVVVARDDLPGGKTLVAYVVPRQENSSAPSPAELREFLRARLPEYMIPSALVALSSLPTTANGKLDRKALPVPRLTPARGQETAITAPRSPQEEIVAGLWAELLGRERVGVEDDFFELGGHSLLATQLLARLRELFPVELSLRQVFETPTVAGLAAVLAQAAGAATAPELAMALTPVPRGEPLPLSFAQQRLWFLERLEPGNKAYNLPFALELVGKLDTNALRHALTAVARRHEALRTVFVETPEGPRQVVLPPRPVEVSYLDLSPLPAAEREPQVEAWLARCAGWRFDLEHGPLWAAGLTRLAPDRHLLALTLHHLVSDGWSMEVLVREVGAFYRVETARVAASLPELPVQYPDYAVWQRRRLEGPRLGELLAAARGQLDELPLLELPADHPRPRQLGSRGAAVPVALEGERATALSALARRLGATPFMVLFAAFAVLLGRLSRQRRFAVGTPAANRDHADLEGLIGLFVNTLVLPVNLSGNPSFAELVARVRLTALAAHEIKELPFDRLVEELAPRRDLGRTPIFQVMFSLENVRAEVLSAPDLELLPRQLPVSAAAFDLTLALAESNRGWHGLFEYNTDLFDPTSVQRFSRLFCQLLAAGLAAPDTAVAALPWISEAERRELLTTSGLGSTAVAGERLEWLVADRAASRPEAIAVVGRAEQWSYGYLLARAAGVAERLEGLELEAPVGLMAERRPEMLAGWLGALAAGAAVLPLDPDQPWERVASLLAGARVVLVTSGVQPLPPAPAEVVVVEHLEPRPWRPSRALPPTALAAVLFTSGSTGRPKGVQLEHRSLAAFVRAAIGLYDLAAGQRVLQFASIGFDTSIEEIFITLASGGTLELRPVDLLGSPARFFAWVAERAITVLDFPTAWWHAVVPHLDEPGAALPKSVERVILGGERALGPAMRSWLEAVGDQVRTWNTYGPSEASVAISAWLARHENRAEGDPPIGRPLPGARIFVLDSRLEPLPWAVPGELYLGGFGLARGYLDQPGETARSFLPDPFGDTPGGRLYKSGDLARLRADGELEFLGRADRQLKIRGVRIEPAEIEAALTALPEVAAAVVVPWKESSAAPEPRLIAYLVGSPGAAPPAPEELRRQLRSRLPEAQIPAEFLLLDKLPLNRNGKIDLAALPVPAASPAPSKVSAASPLEELVLEAFAAVLAINSPAREASFFELGGHSLSAARLVARLRTATGIDLPLVEVFETPTAAGLAHRLAALDGTTGETEPITAQTRPAEIPTTFAQEQLWFVHQLAPSSSQYHIPEAVHIEGPLDLGRLAAAFSALATRQESLRTRFPSRDGRPFQEILPPLPTRLPLVDLAALPRPRRHTAAARLLAEATSRPFELSQAPPHRALVLREAEGQHIVGVVIHHILADGASIDLLMRELLLTYDQRGPYLEAPRVQVADFALWQRRQLTPEVLSALLTCVRGRLAEIPEELFLPSDLLGMEDEEPRGGLVPFAIPAAAMEALASLARGEGATLYMLLLAAYHLLLSRYSGSDVIPVSIFFGGRDRAELAPLIGLFVNTLVVPVDLSGEPSFRSLLARVRQATLEALRHRQLPFSKLVEDLRAHSGVPRSLSQAAFSYDQIAQPELPPDSPLVVTPFPASNSSAPLELTLEISASPTGLAGTLRYDARRFSPAAAERIVQHYNHLLAALLQDPAASASDLPLEGEAAPFAQLATWARTPPLAEAGGGDSR